MCIRVKFLDGISTNVEPRAENLRNAMLDDVTPAYKDLTSKKEVVVKALGEKFKEDAMKGPCEVSR